MASGGGGGYGAYMGGGAEATAGRSASTEVVAADVTDSLPEDHRSTNKDFSRSFIFDGIHLQQKTYIPMGSPE